MCLFCSYGSSGKDLFCTRTYVQCTSAFPYHFLSNPFKEKVLGRPSFLAATKEGGQSFPQAHDLLPDTVRGHPRSFGWSRMSGRRTSGSSRASLGGQVLAAFSFISLGKFTVQKYLGERVEVPDILLPDIRGLLNLAPHRSPKNC